MRFDVKVKGLEEALKGLNKLSPDSFFTKADNVIEAYVRKMANESADNAPIKDGILVGSIVPSVGRDPKGNWQYGSDVDYAPEQEFENPRKSAFFRNSVNKYGPELSKALSKLLE